MGEHAVGVPAGISLLVMAAVAAGLWRWADVEVCAAMSAFLAVAGVACVLVALSQRR